MSAKTARRARAARARSDFPRVIVWTRQNIERELIERLADWLRAKGWDATVLGGLDGGVEVAPGDNAAALELTDDTIRAWIEHEAPTGEEVTTPDHLEGDAGRAAAPSDMAGDGPRGHDAGEDPGEPPLTANEGPAADGPSPTRPADNEPFRRVIVRVRRGGNRMFVRQLSANSRTFTPAPADATTFAIRTSDDERQLLDDLEAAKLAEIELLDAEGLQ